MDVGIRELKNSLSKYLAEVRHGETVIVTDHGRAIARIISIAEDSPLDQLIAEGVVQPPTAPKTALPDPIETAGPVSDLVGDQRR